MSKRTVLVVDDESTIREFLAQVLSMRYQVILAKCGSEALRLARTRKVSVILLDILMPGKSGIDVCKELRTDPATRSISIIMLTALNEPDQRTQAFIAGADDFVSKPFNPDELLARVEAKIRRSEEIKPQVVSTLQFGDLSLDFIEQKAEIAGQPIEVGQIELKILKCLIHHEGQLVGRDVLHQFVWGDESPSDRALDPHITTLRKKLSSSRGILKTVYGKGYSLVLRDGSST